MRARQNGESLAYLKQRTPWTTRSFGSTLRSVKIYRIRSGSERIKYSPSSQGRMSRPRHKLHTLQYLSRSLPILGHHGAS